MSRYFYGKSTISLEKLYKLQLGEVVGLVPKRKLCACTWMHSLARCQRPPVAGICAWQLVELRLRRAPLSASTAQKSWMHFWTNASHFTTAWQLSLSSLFLLFTTSVAPPQSPVLAVALISQASACSVVLSSWAQVSLKKTFKNPTVWKFALSCWSCVTMLLLYNLWPTQALKTSVLWCHGSEFQFSLLALLLSWKQ